jgi:hypothetical protein
MPAKRAVLHVQLQRCYRGLLDDLGRGFAVGLPAGASVLNDARTQMIGAGGIDALGNRLRRAGLRVVFDPIRAPQYAPLGPPAP